MRVQSRSLLLVSLAACVVACAATSVPDPPDLTAPDPSHVTATPVQTIVVPTTEIEGGPGSALPGAILRITPLFGTDPAVATIVHEDGSFSTNVDWVGGALLRLQLFSGASRSPPVDALVPDTIGPLVPVMRQACLVTVPPLELEVLAGAPALIEIHNQCSDGVQLGARLRVPSSVFSVQPMRVPTIAVDASDVVMVELSSTISGSYENIVLLDVSQPFVEARPITIRASVP